MSDAQTIKLHIKDEDDISVPTLIQHQFSQLQALRNNVELATKKAEKAQNSVKYAKEKSAGFFKKKEAIESLQNAAVDLADAQISAAEAQEVSFEYQQKLGEITKYLFGLGVTNIAANRSVVRELEMRLKGASEEELDEFARQELLGVVKQLKAQEDIMKKQSELSQWVKEHEDKLEAHEIKNYEYDKYFEYQAEKYKEYDLLLEMRKNKDIEHDRLFIEKTKKDEARDKEIARQAAKDVEHERLIAEQTQKGEQRDKLLVEVFEKDKLQDKEIMRQAEKIVEHERLIAEQMQKGEQRDKLLAEVFEKDKLQDKEIVRQAEKDDEHDKLLNELIHDNLEKENKIDELKKLCNQLSEKIVANSNYVNDVQGELLNKIDRKSGKEISAISLVIALVALALSISQFLQ